MRLFVPYYHPSGSLVHRVWLPFRLLYVLLVLVLCWVGVYQMSVAWGYAVLTIAFVTSLTALVIATNLRSGARLMVIPAILGLTWIVLFIIAAGIDAVRHLEGTAKHATSLGLIPHLTRQLIANLRRVVALFASTTSAWLLVTTVSASELRDLRIVPGAVALDYALFSSLLARFRATATRLAHANRQATASYRRRDVLSLTQVNPLLSLWKAFVVFVVAVAGQIPHLWNLRHVKERILEGRLS